MKSWLMLGLLASQDLAPIPPEPPVAPARDPVFESCMAGLRTQATARGIDITRFNDFTRTITPDMSVLTLLDA